MNRRLIRLGLLGLVTAATLAAANPAAASVTIGQLAPSNDGPSTCVDPLDLPQPTVTSGNTYVVPELPPAGALSVISWSTNAQPGPGQMLTMKIFRKLADPATFMVVGHDGPRDLGGGTVNSFQTSIPVQPGDVLGLNSANAASVGNLCSFTAPGELNLFRFGDLADGQSGDFGSDSDLRVNATAVVAPSNAFSLGATTRNQKKGTATLNLNVPNPGDLTASGNGARVASGGGARISKSVTPGPAQLVIKAKGKKKRKLNETGKVKLSVAVTYTPTGGEPSTQSVKVKLKKKL